MDTLLKDGIPTGSWPRVDASRVPLWVYSDRDNYQRELERIFYGPSWHFVGIDTEVPNTGDYKRATIGEEGRSKSARGSSCWTILPSSIRATRCPSCAASARSWVTNRVVSRRSR